MKLLFVISMALSSPARAANNGAQTYPVHDAELGTFTVQVTENEDPIDEKLALNVSVLCRNLRKSTVEYEPVANVFPEPLPICDFRPAPTDYDPKAKVLTLHYSVLKSGRGQSECGKNLKQKFYLRTLCAPWQP